nr:hypothetical protein [Tanacetum cinerariifolium]
MGGSSSQPHTEQPMSPIHSFRNEDMYSPQYSKDMYQNTAEESPVEVTALPQKPSRRRQKRMVAVQNEDTPCRTPWTNKEEMTMCKGWVHVFENSAKGNARKTDGFGTKVLAYLRNKTKQPGRQTYDMVNEKWKTVLPNMDRFYGVHANVLRGGRIVEPEMKTTSIRHFLTMKLNLEYTLHFVIVESFNLNVDEMRMKNEAYEVPRPIGRDKAKGSKKKGVGSSGSSINMIDEALVGLIVFELATQTEV